MQTAIVILIVSVVAFLLARRFYNSISASKNGGSTCGCGCDGCGPTQKQNCTEPEDPDR